MYKVIVRFADAQDDNYIYEVGDEYPRDGKKVSETRIAELASNKNGARKVLIAEEKEPEVAPETPEMPQIEPEPENQEDIQTDEKKSTKGK